MIGANKEHLNDIKSDLPKNITTKFIYKKFSNNSKRRYVDYLTKGKIFGIYRINDEILNKKDELKFNSLLNHEIKKSDLVVVSDYGHGLISKKVRK